MPATDKLVFLQNIFGNKSSQPTLDEEHAAKMQATIDHQKKELAKQWQKLSRYHNEESKSYQIV